MSLMFFSPDGMDHFGALDLTVRGNQRNPLDKRGGSDNTVRSIFGISSRKPHGARTRAAANR